MKDTILNGKKNNLYYHHRGPHKNSNLSNRYTSHAVVLYSSGLPINNNSFCTYPQNQRMFYHINNIRAINRIGPHNKDVLSVIIGSVLGDAYLNRRSGEGVRVCYRQSQIHKEYLFWLYDFLYNRGYTTNLQPRQYTRTIESQKGTVYYGYEFNTFTFRSFNWIHQLFYNKGKKVIPRNIAEYLTPLALAVWVMDDGGWANSGVRIATNSFELKEVELLNDVLKSRYNLDTTIQKIFIKDKYSIYIKKQSIPALRSIVGPFMHPSMLYKLGIDNT